MAIESFTDIKAEAADYLKRSDLTTKIATTFTRLTEKAIVRNFTQRGLESWLRTRKTMTASASFSMPSRCRGLPDVVYLDTNPKQLLNYMPPDAFYRRWISTETGKPKAYTIEGNTIILGPSPDSAYSVVFVFKEEPNAAIPTEQYLIPDKTEAEYDGSPPTEGSFSGGTGHAAGDVITLSDGSEVTVNTVSGGVVTEFTITHADWSDTADDGDTLTQSSTTGSGASFSLTIGVDDIAPLTMIRFPELYLYGIVAEGYRYVRNMEQAGYYQGLFMAVLDDLEAEGFMSGSGVQIFNQEASAGTPRRSR